MQKSKVFSKKLISLVLAVVMAVSSFFGVISTAYAYQNGKYHDADSTIGASALAWVEASDDATLEALLDTADDFLANADWAAINKSIPDIAGLLPSQAVQALGLSIVVALPNVSISTTSSVLTVNVSGNIGSIDGIIDLMFKLKKLIKTDVAGASGLAGLIGYNLDGIVDALDFTTFGSYFYDEATSSANGVQNDSGKRDDKSWRDENTAKFIIRGFLKWILVDNRASLIDKLLSGDLSLVTDNNGDLINVYKIIGDLVGIDYDAWYNNSSKTYYNKASNGVLYNIAKAAIVNNIGYYKDQDNYKDTYLKEQGSAWVYDNEIYNIANYFLDKLSFDITYPNYATYTAEMELKTKWDDTLQEDVFIGGRFEDTSKRRYYVAKQAGKFDAATGKIDADFATANGWDPNLYYSTEEGYEGNVLVAKYGNTTATVTRDDTIYELLWKALPIAWKTAFKPTIELLHVNYNGHDVHGTNFDNAYFYWINENYKVDGEYYEWVRGENYKSNYNATMINAWANAKYADYGFESAADFIDYVKETVTYKKTRVAKKEAYNWRDIDSTILFNEIRFSPLADFFGIQTGPLNLYFEQTGAPAIIDYFDDLFDDATNVANGFDGSLMLHLDNALVTAMEDLFPNSTHIGKLSIADGAYSFTKTSLPQLDTTDSTTVADIVETLIDDAAAIFQYAADATDGNLLTAFYALNGDDAVVDEDNIESALIPLAISALKNWNLTASIHNSEWDKVNSVESMAVIALREYLDYLYPERDSYDSLYTLSDTVYMDEDETVGYKYVIAPTAVVNGETVTYTLLDHAIMPMAADALVFVLTAAGMPFFEQTSSTCSSSGAVIKPLDYTFVGKGDGLDNLFWQSLNATVCYFAVDKKITTLANAPTAVKYTNDIWTNADNVINTLLPVLGPLIGESDIDTKDLLWNKIVLSAADISKKTDRPGQKGFTQILTIIGNLLTSYPLNGNGTKDANNYDAYSVFNAVIFDVVKPLINLLLGGRDSVNSDIIGVSKTTSNPLNTFLVKGNVNGSIDNLLINLVHVLNGTNSDGTANATKMATSNNSVTCVCFILLATHLLPKLRDNTIGGVSATLADHVVGQNFQTRVAIRNESWGINDFYVDSTGAVKETGRYPAVLTSVKVINVSTGQEASGVSIAPSDPKYSMPSGQSTVTLAPEELTRLTLTGSSVATGLYRVEVSYTMSRSVLSSAASGASASTDTEDYAVKAVDFFNVSNSTSGDYAWSDAFSGDYADSEEDNNHPKRDAGLITTQTSGDLQIYAPTLILAGSNAASCKRGYLVVNSALEYDNDGVQNTNYVRPSVNVVCATVAADTTNYYLKSGVASSSANSNAAWAAVNKDGYVLNANGEVTSTTAAALAASEDAVGYIKNSDNEITAVAVNKSAIGNYTPGTPIGGVYLDTEAITIEGANAKSSQKGSEGRRLIAANSDSGLDAQYNKMNVLTSLNTTFTTTIAAGDIDGNYSSLKDLSAGLATHYYTSAVVSEYSAVTSLIVPAMLKTLSSGVNLDNIAYALNVKEEVEALKDAAFTHPTEELTDVITKVIKSRRDRSNINYVLVANYEEAVDMAKDVEQLITTEPQWTKKIVNGEEKDVPVYEDSSNRYQLCYYLSYSPCIVLAEGARVFYSLYMPQAKLRQPANLTVAQGKNKVFNLLYGEITHATSQVDEWDNTIGNGSEYYYDVTETSSYMTTDGFPFTANADESRDPYRFTYSSKDDNEWDNVNPYYITASEEGIDVKYGTVAYDDDLEDVALINLDYDEDDNEIHYTDSSWQAYVDALGECIELAQTRDTATNKTVSAAYDARSHLVIAENNLEIVDEGGEVEPEDPPVVSEDITISGKVVLATQADGDTNEGKGFANAKFVVDGNNLTENGQVVTTAADGTFSITVPKGTTSIIITNWTYVDGTRTSGTGTTIDRTITIGGQSDVNNATIPIIICDWNCDGYVQANDLTAFKKYKTALDKNETSYNPNYDTNGDGFIQSNDKTYYKRFKDKGITSASYTGITLS